MTLPYTGQEFLDSLDDGREVWIYGQRVRKITEHPAFRNTARMIARLYDALHADHRDDRRILTCSTEWGGFTHRYFIGTAHGRRTGRRAGCDCCMVADHLWLARALARLQGGLSGYAGRQCGLLCSISGKRAALVSPQPGACAIHQPRYHPPAR